jgi:hypothetical protein
VIWIKLYWHPAISLAKLYKILVIWMKLYWLPAMQVMYKIAQPGHVTQDWHRNHINMGSYVMLCVSNVIIPMTYVIFWDFLGLYFTSTAHFHLHLTYVLPMCFLCVKYWCLWYILRYFIMSWQLRSTYHVI